MNKKIVKRNVRLFLNEHKNDVVNAHKYISIGGFYDKQEVGMKVGVTIAYIPHTFLADKSCKKDRFILMPDYCSGINNEKDIKTSYKQVIDYVIDFFTNPSYCQLYKRFIRINGALVGEGWLTRNNTEEILKREGIA